MQRLTLSPSSEEEVMERDEDRVSPECHDATDLICGLIRELSSLKLVNASLFCVYLGYVFFKSFCSPM